MEILCLFDFELTLLSLLLVSSGPISRVLGARCGVFGPNYIKGFLVELEPSLPALLNVGCAPAIKTDVCAWVPGFGCVVCLDLWAIARITKSWVGLLLNRRIPEKCR